MKSSVVHGAELSSGTRVILFLESQKFFKARVLSLDFCEIFWTLSTIIIIVISREWFISESLPKGILALANPLMASRQVEHGLCCWGKLGEKDGKRVKRGREARETRGRMGSSGSKRGRRDSSESKVSRAEKVIEGSRRGGGRHGGRGETRVGIL